MNKVGQMGKCSIAKILFYAYSLILLVGFALFAVVNYYPPAQDIVLEEGARVDHQTPHGMEWSERMQPIGALCVTYPLILL